MTARGPVLLAWLLWAVFAIGLGAGAALSIAQGTAGDLPELVPFLVAVAAFATVGALVASRRPRNPIGWIFLGIGVLTGIGALGEPYSEWAFARPGALPPGAVLAAWTHQWFWFPLLGLSTVFTLLLFPSGLPSRRWRPVLWVSTLSVAAVTVAEALTPTLSVAGRSVPNPIGLDALSGADVEQSLVGQALFAVLSVCLLASVASLVVRYRHSRGQERQQLKWFVFAATLLGLQVAGDIASPAYADSVVSLVLFGLILALLPISAGIAILRYRLYEIDRIINRALVYGALTLLLGGLYVGVVVGVGSLVGDSGLLVAASTLLVAALFRPARGRIQALIDRRFYRRRYDAARTLQTFAARLRDEVDLDALSHELVALVEKTMQPAHASLWLRRAEGGT